MRWNLYWARQPPNTLLKQVLLLDTLLMAEKIGTYPAIESIGKSCNHASYDSAQ